MAALTQACSMARMFHQACENQGAFPQRLLKPLTLPFLLEDETAYGRRFPQEVRTLCGLAEAGALPRVNSITPHLFGTPFICADETSAFQQVLAGDLQQVFPLHWSCHLAGLAPMAYTGVTYEVHLLHLETDRGDAVTVYEDGSGGLHATRASLAGCWAGELLRDVENGPGGVQLPAEALSQLRQWAQAQLVPPARAIDDPLHLHQRSLWLLKALTDDYMVDLREVLRYAPPMSAFDDEVPDLPARPSLALYWLGAQALMGAPGGFERVCELTCRHPSALVRSLRAFLVDWWKTDRKGPLTALDAELTARMLADLHAIRASGMGPAFSGT